MLNLVLLSLGIVASNAALSCNGVSYFAGAMQYIIPAGVCIGSIDDGKVSSEQYVCKLGKMKNVTYASSSDCTGDYTEAEICLDSTDRDCTSVCDKDICEYTKHETYWGVTSCDPIVGSTLLDLVYISGQCLEITGLGSQSWSCDSSASTATLKTYTSADCTGGSTDVEYALETLCDESTGVASIY
eukprot:340196_1